MGCLYSIVAFGDDRAATEAALERALDEVDRLDRLLSHYRPDSPLSQMNRAASRRAVEVPAELFALIATSLAYSRESDGAFDVTVGPLMKAWGFFGGEGRLPDPRELEDVRRRIGHRHVMLDRGARTVRFEREGMEIDLGGIGKGYAVDRAVAVLKAEGVRSALVSACGSTIYGLGSPPGEAAWQVDVADPIRSDAIGYTIPLVDRALSISGTSEKWFEVDGVRYSHIMDPRTARPVQGVIGVDVIADTGLESDALDNALFVLGPEQSRELWRRHPKTEAWFILPDGGRGWTRVPLR